MFDFVNFLESRSGRARLLPSPIGIVAVFAVRLRARPQPGLGLMNMFVTA